MPTKTKSRVKEKRKTRKQTSKLPELLAFDQSILTDFPADTRLIGIDEVGRGSCVGPIYAAAVCFPKILETIFLELLTELNDSKQVSAAARKQLCSTLQTHCVYGVGIAQKEEVDEHNVYHASLLASYRAYQNVLNTLKQPDGNGTLLLLDGKALLPGVELNKQKAIIKGDGRSAVIAGASIIAKHLRDQQIIAWAKDYPGYSWETNMGYPTPTHKRAILELGPTPLHRIHYKAVREAQIALF